MAFMKDMFNTKKYRETPARIEYLQNMDARISAVSRSQNLKEYEKNLEISKLITQRQNEEREWTDLDHRIDQDRERIEKEQQRRIKFNETYRNKGIVSQAAAKMVHQSDNTEFSGGAVSQAAKKMSGK